MRVLAVVTGGWTLPQFATPERYALMHRQLMFYLEACEKARGSRWLLGGAAGGEGEGGGLGAHVMSVGVLWHVCAPPPNSHLPTPTAHPRRATTCTWC